MELQDSKSNLGKDLFVPSVSIIAAGHKEDRYKQSGSPRDLNCPNPAPRKAIG